jgi:uncharacterized membrane protein SpoIIM required for sporulation
VEGRARKPEATFEKLLARCERLRPGGLSFDELRELARRYRATLARLARLREQGDDDEAIRHLNSLCARAHAHLAITPAAAVSGPPLLARIPEALARTWWAQLSAWALLILGITAGAALVSNDPRAVYGLVPATLGYEPDVLDRLLSSPEARAHFLARSETPASANLLFGSWLFANNTRVGLLAFATGMLAGIPTVLLAVYNGVTVGALGAVFFRDELPVDFLAWILPHGVPELTAVTLCVAGGLVLGGAIAAPGRKTRAEALREAAPGAEDPGRGAARGGALGAAALRGVGALLPAGRAHRELRTGVGARHPLSSRDRWSDERTGRCGAPGHPLARAARAQGERLDPDAHGAAAPSGVAAVAKRQVAIEHWSRQPIRCEVEGMETPAPQGQQSPLALAQQVLEHDPAQRSLDPGA